MTEISTDPHHVKPAEIGVARIFNVAIAQDDFDSLGFDPATPQGLDRLKTALGATRLESGHVELFDVATLGDLGLTGYMRDGLGIAEKDIAPKRPVLDNIAGHVLIVLSRAFGGEEQQLAPEPSLELVGAFAEDRPAVSFEPLPAGGAQGAIAPTGEPIPPKQGNSVWLLALLGVAIAIAVLFWAFI